MELKFYYDYNEFINNFDDNFKEWQKEFPSGDLYDFACYYFVLYGPFSDYSENSYDLSLMDVFNKFNDGVEKKNGNELKEFKEFFKANNFSKNKVDTYIDYCCKFLYEEDGLVYYDYTSLINFIMSVPKIMSYLMVIMETENNDEKFKRDLKNRKKTTTNKEQTKQKPKFKTNITQTQLVELVKALIENGTIQGTQKNIMNDFANFFGIEVNNPNKLIQDIKGRSNGGETLFLDDLSSSLFDYLSK